MLCQLQRFADTVLLFRLFAHRDHVTRLDQAGRDVDRLAIDGDGFVRNQLAGLSTCRAKAHAVDHIVQTRLQQEQQVRAGIGALPRGQRYAALAVGLTTTQSYRYVILPMALRIVIPPLTSESMNIIKNSSVAFAVSVAELTLFAMQAQEETSKGIEIYLGVTALYVVSALSVNRVMAFIESRTRVPGFIAAASSGGH